MIFSMELQAIIALTILFELITVAPRLTLKVRSKDVQKRLGIPRIHHGYIGMGILLASYLFIGHADVLWVIGWALILSDLVHHYTILPLLSVTETDIYKKHYGLHPTSIRRKALIALFGVGVVIVLSSISDSLWIGMIAIALIAISENLKVLMPRYGCPQEVANHF